VWKWLARLLGQGAADGPAIELERRSQSLRLELEERDRVIANLKAELARQRGSASAHVTEAVQVQVEGLLADVATPVAQLLTQAHLLEVEGQPVQARDVLAVAKRLVRALEDKGLTLEGRVGETVPFDPDCHELLSADAPANPGQRVVVRFVGVAYQGKLLRRAGVEGRAP
jgi:molecular chaperone GrpE (heat shock protein)